ATRRTGSPRHRPACDGRVAVGTASAHRGSVAWGRLLPNATGLYRRPLAECRSPRALLRRTGAGAAPARRTIPPTARHLLLILALRADIRDGPERGPHHGHPRHRDRSTRLAAPLSPPRDDSRVAGGAARDPGPLATARMAPG